ncbi:MAG TPA: MBL fold metallo-hydrolase [Longimicrobiales bacterium]|nr:MBL fold metallo-hydrolase [Longimicrobiales bacterium]
MKLIFEQIRVGGDRNFAYLLADRDAKQGVLIDPAYAPEMLVERAEAQGIEITHVVNTHGHPDHIEGNQRAVEATGAKVAAHPDCPVGPEVALPDGASLHVGSLQLRCLHTPGHAADHLVLYEPTYRILVSADLIFVGKVGGTAKDDDARTEWASIQRVLREIPDEATVWPGHDYGVRPSSTIGLERRTNPFLRCPDEQAFLDLKRDWASLKKELGLK